MKPGEKATINNSHEEIVKAYNSLCDEYYRLLHGPSDSALWHSYFCACLSDETDSLKEIENAAVTADKALEEYKKRWRDE